METKVFFFFVEILQNIFTMFPRFCSFDAEKKKKTIFISLKLFGKKNYSLGQYFQIPPLAYVYVILRRIYRCSETLTVFS